MYSAITQWDLDILYFFQEHVRVAWLDPIMKAITHVGDYGILWIGLCIALLIPKKTRWIGIVASSALLLSFIVNNLMLKPIVGRIRPYELDPGIQCIVKPPFDLSFPSGHAANAMTVCLGIALASWRKWAKWIGICMVGFAVLMGFTRIYVCVHYPTDVFVGLGTGAVCAVAAFFICREVEKRHARKHGITELELSVPANDLSDEQINP